jgi:hypothetical protein
MWVVMMKSVPDLWNRPRFRIGCSRGAAERLTDTILTLRCQHCMTGVEFRSMIAHKDGRFVHRDCAHTVCPARQSTRARAGGAQGQVHRLGVGPSASKGSASRNARSFGVPYPRVDVVSHVIARPIKYWSSVTLTI